MALQVLLKLFIKDHSDVIVVWIGRRGVVRTATLNEIVNQSHSAEFHQTYLIKSGVSTDNNGSEN